ncbi:TonB-dependent receptor [Thalassotalea sp. PS06]|nr:TonB-dependent receptor [Thalassotalea sp. PS06]
MFRILTCLLLPIYANQVLAQEDVGEANAVESATIETAALENSALESKALETIVVEGNQVNLIGGALSASEGVIGQSEISIRPISRTGEILEFIPGMVVTQHSGSGKANQYFLRGFNLDHGTDFATYVDGMPVNMRSHGHGQGYTDLSFLIPEAVGKMRYRKGSYYADIGDFSGAGGVAIETSERLENDLLSIGLGENGFQRALLMMDAQFVGGSTLFAAERQHYDGPWDDINEDVGKTNLLLKHTRPVEQGQFSVAVMGYDNAWNSADQIPSRAVAQGLLSEFGSIDKYVGGESSRYSINATFNSDSWQASAYVIDYQLNLWSNFTYFLDDEQNGDQFEQVDNRNIYGGHLQYSLASSFAKMAMNNRLGFEFRVDDIQEVSLYQTRQRQRLGVTRSDEVTQHSISAYWENRIEWSDRISTVIGARYDSLDFDVDNLAGINRFGIDLNDNSGKADDDLLSLKGNLVYWINDSWEAYVSAGQGFHSNDARGTTITIDPLTGEDADRVDPLVRSTGYEFGIRGFSANTWNVSAALWSLKLDSELLFVGDAGNTEASRPSERIGIELAAYYQFNEIVSVDIEYANTDAKFQGDEPEGNRIPGTVRDVVQAGLNLDFNDTWFASLRYRYFGKRPLIEDDSVTSDATSIVNLRLGYQRSDWRATLDILNLADSNYHDIDYFYESRLASETDGVEDIHFHPIEPRALRLTLELRW